MSLKHLKHKDQKKRKIFKKFEFKRLILKALSFHITLPLYLRERVYLLLKNFRTISISLLRNRCVISNKPRYIFTKYKLSRLALKRYLVQGKIMGLYKVTW